MKIKEGYLLRNIAGESVVVPMGKAILEFNGLIRVNETGAFLWELLREDCDSQKLVDAVVSEYEIDAESARGDIDSFIETLREGGILQDE